MLQHNASGDTPSGGLKKSKAQKDVINLVSDSEDDDGSTPPLLAPALKRRASNISGSREANPRPIKKPSLPRSDITTPQARKPSSSMPTGKTAHGGANNLSRLEIAQKQTRLANAKVAELEAKLNEVNAELLATKNTLSHRDAEVTSYQRIEAELMRTKGLLSRKEVELEDATKENKALIEQIEQMGIEKQEFPTQLKTEADADQAGEQLKAEALLEDREKAPEMAEMEEELAESRIAAAASDALCDSYKEHIGAMEASLAAANRSLDRARTTEEVHIARITQLEEEIHGLETVRDGLETTNEEILTKLDSAGADIKAGEAREKAAEQKEKEYVAELLREIAAVKIEVILLTDKKEELEIHHSQETSKAAVETASLKEKLLQGEKTVEKLQGRIDNCSICSMNYDEQVGLWHLAQDIRAMIRSHREGPY
ncbi:hypothetical protein PG985_010298 [Apiospora marii]|uniref:Uncharacterized protein n=1 Tax=Apiospora marii TaxID=335849 RepID=A0ABR1RLH8_9PEZI